MSGNVIRPQFGPKPPVTTDEYFGGCPECGKTSGYIDHGQDHWFCCDAHRTRWYIGSNLFSSCQEAQGQDEIAQNTKVLTYRVVAPVRMLLPPCEALPADAEIRTPGDFGRWLDELTADEAAP